MQAENHIFLNTHVWSVQMLAMCNVWESGLFISQIICSPDYSYHVWTIHTMDCLYHAHSYDGFFIPRTFHTGTINSL